MKSLTFVAGGWSGEDKLIAEFSKALRGWSAEILGGLREFDDGLKRWVKS